MCVRMERSEVTSSTRSGIPLVLGLFSRAGDACDANGHPFSCCFALTLTDPRTNFVPAPLLSFPLFPWLPLFLRTDLGVLAAAAGVAGVFSFLHCMKRRRADTRAQQHHVSGILPATAPSGTLQIAKHGRRTDTLARPPTL